MSAADNAAHTVQGQLRLSAAEVKTTAAQRSYKDLKITHFHKSRVAVERWWPKQGSDDDPRTLLPPLPLGFCLNMLCQWNLCLCGSFPADCLLLYLCE